MGVSNKGSYRGVPCFVTSDDLEFGRRNQVHEYPLRDEPYVEDFGKKGRSFNLSLVVIGPDHDRDRDAMVAALEQPGPGTFIHPDLGMMTVFVISARRRTSSRERGKTTFSVTFIAGEGEPRYPQQYTDTAQVLDQAADTTVNAAIDDFANVFDTVGMASNYVDKLTDDLASALGGVEDAVGDVAGDIANLIRAPYDMAVLIAGTLNTLADQVGEPARALAIYENMAGTEAATSTGTTPNAKQLASNQAAQSLLMRSTALAEATRLARTMDWDTADDATGAMDRLLALLDALLLIATDDDLYQALRALRVAFVADINNRVAKLPQVKTVILAGSLPALVLAYQLHGDAERDAEIINRNHIRHPGFVPGGQELEVLDA